MQNRLHTLAVRLAWLQPLAIVAGSLALIVAITAAISQQPATERLLVPALLLSCWCLLVFTLINVFRAALPAIEANSGFWRRQIVRFRRLIRGFLALCFVLLTLALLLFSYRLLTTGVG